MQTTMTHDDEGAVQPVTFAPRCCDQAASNMDRRRSTSLVSDAAGGRELKPVDFCILGPLKVTVDGASVPIRGHRRTRLLIRLLVSANRVVRFRQLAEDVGDSAERPLAASTIASHVYLLRDLLDRGRIATHGAGYAIRVEPDELDVMRFEEDLRLGRQSSDHRNHAGSIAHLERALSWWRGSALSDVAELSWSAPEIARLDDLRNIATEHLLESHLLMGRYEEAAVRAAAAVHDEPLRESRWAILMRALYQCGRQADALRVYQDLRTVLRREVGLEPSPDLRRLELAILQQDTILEQYEAAAGTPDRIAVTHPEVVAAGASHLGTAVSQLPVARTRLIGREREVDDLTHLAAEHRLVTLTGIGGCGKTRLGIAVATRLFDQHSDGVHLVEFGAATSHQRIADVIADSLGIRLRHADGTRGTGPLAAFLAQHPLLLVLDGCEHRIDEVATFVDELLTSGSAARVLATSREPLGLAGEQIHRVRPLDTDPDVGAPAVELFLERGAEASSTFELAPDDLPVITEICRQLDGLPLAIELAAAQLQVLPPRELLSRLGHRFELLTGGRARQPSHQTLEAVMDSSWILLTDEERSMLIAMSVLAGAWTLATAEAICAGVSGSLVTVLVRSLVAKSLVEPQAGTTANRFRILDTVRLYAHRRGTEVEVEAARNRHLEWFVEWVNHAPVDEQCLSIVWARRVALEFDDLACATTWAISKADWSGAVALIAATTAGSFLGLHPLWTLASTDALPSDALSPPLRTRAVIAEVMAAIPIGRHHRLRVDNVQEAQGDASLVSLICLMHAIPLIIPDPALARSLLVRAEDLASSVGSDLTMGVIRALQIIRVFTTDPGDVNIGAADAQRFSTLR